MNPTPIAKMPEAPARERRVPVLTPEALHIHANKYVSRNIHTQYDGKRGGAMIENAGGGRSRGRRGEGRGVGWSRVNR